jgi:heat-inducible transcriptional repressor
MKNISSAEQNKTLVSERDRFILEAVIERHTTTAEPVSSSQLCHQYGFDWSSATVRSIMARLEEAGFLASPYTSAGKIPTLKAYQYFVAELMNEQHVADIDQVQIKAEVLQQVQETDQIMKLTARVLAMVSNLLAVSWLPVENEERLAGVSLRRLAPHRILMVVRTTRNHEHHQVFTCEHTMARLIDQVAAGVNEWGLGKTAAELENLAQTDCPGMDRHMLALWRRALILIVGNLNLSRRESMLVEGTTNLIQQPEFDDINAARQLVAMLDHREELLRFFTAPAINRGGVHVMISEDHYSAKLPALAFVSYRVLLDHGRCARIGVIGPRRMAYSRIIPLVEYTAEALNQAMTGM